MGRNINLSIASDVPFLAYGLLLVLPTDNRFAFTASHFR